MNDPLWPAESMFTVTPSDSTVFTQAVRQLYVGVTGNITVTDAKTNTDIVFQNVPAGFYLGPFFISKVKAATTASSLVAFV